MCCESLINVLNNFPGPQLWISMAVGDVRIYPPYMALNFPLGEGNVELEFSQQREKKEDFELGTKMEQLIALPVLTTQVQLPYKLKSFRWAFHFIAIQN